MQNKLNNFLIKKENFRLLLVILLLLIFVISIYLFLVLPALHGDIYQEKEVFTSEMVESELAVLDHFNNLENQGILSGEEARERAALLIRSMRYGEEDLDYFWIIDYDATVIVHPFRPELEGTDVSDTEDESGFPLFREMIRIAQEEGAGHLTYQWQYYDDSERTGEKLSYVAAFEPWHWIIGTGVYLTDLEEAVAWQRNIAALVLTVIFALAAAVTYYYYRGRQKEKELLQSEEKYRLIAENTADTITVMDMGLNYLYVSPSVYNLHGFTPAEAMERTLEQTLTPESLGLARKTLQRELLLLADDKADLNKTVQLELEEYKKDGSTIWVENSISYMKNRAGEPIGILCVSKDITEKKKQEEKLQKEQREKNLILENMAELVTYMDREMRIIWANRAVTGNHRQEPYEYMGEKCFQVWHGYTQPCPGCPVVECLETGCRTVNTIEYPGGRCWRVNGTPVYDEKGQIIGALDTSLDITELKETENELKHLNEELEQRVRERTAELEQANQELTAFTYSVSHDLRAPLRSIGGFSAAVLEDYGERLDEQGVDYLKRVCASAHQMNNLIDELLKLSRVTRQELHRDSVNLTGMAEAYARHLREKDPQRRVEFVVAEGLEAFGDVALLRIALENMLDNAWKFTVASNPGRIELGCFKKESRKIYFVRDNGIGFDMAYAGDLFNPFRRLHPPDAYPGSGIGLSIVQRIIDRHGGRIWAEGKPGEGATFYFTLDLNK
ncbi:MAG: cache domain-containing protein [Bacillota bacterium]|nr:cache domain-containing protein [Bacillota bacterium]